MHKYENAKRQLETVGEATMKCHGNSMLPILANPSICIYKKQNEYKVGDIVFCKVKGRYIDAHLITAIRKDGDKILYLISNNHGHNNGWTCIVYGRVIKSVNSNGETKNHE